jgi:peptidyl-prolyl cis-trans isomerase C
MTVARRRRPIRRFVPVTVNGVQVTSADIVRETQHHPATDPDEAWDMAARALAIRELLTQEADRLNVFAEPLEDDQGRRETPEEALLRALVEQQVVVPRADEATCRRYYDANLRRFRSPDLSEVAHILLPRTEDARALAESLIEELRQRPERFAEAVAAHSACPSAKQAGNLGQIGPGQTVPEFEDALAGMVVGEIHAEPVETRYGLHIVRLDRRIEGRQLPFELVHRRIAEYLDEAVRRRALQQYVSILAGRAQVTGVELAGANGPLVQ